jgi:hypothetical protein
MSFLTAIARHCFLPRWMILGIRQPEMAYADASIEILRYEDGWGVPGGYSLQQRQLILDFLQLMRARNGGQQDQDLEEAWDLCSDAAPEGEQQESEQDEP